MSSKKNTNSLVRITVVLFLDSEKLTIEQISERVGMQPDSCRRQGDLNKASKPFPKSSWKITSQRHLSENADEVVTGMNGCLREVLSRLENHRDRFRQLALEEDAGLLVGISANDVPPMIIEGDIIDQISSLKLRQLEIDLLL